MKLRIDEVYDYNRNWTYEYTSAIWNHVKAEESMSILSDTHSKKYGNTVMYRKSDPSSMYHVNRSRFWHMLAMQTLSMTFETDKDWDDTFETQPYHLNDYVQLRRQSVRHIRPDELFYQVMHSYDIDFENKYSFLQSYTAELHGKFLETDFKPFSDSSGKRDVTIMLHEIKFDLKKLPSSYCRPETFISTYRVYEHTQPKDHAWVTLSDRHSTPCFCNKQYYTITDHRDNCIFCGIPITSGTLEKYMQKKLYEIQARYRMENGIAKRGPIPPKVRMSVLNRDGLLCQTCGTSLHASEVVMAHIVSVSYAGKIGMTDSLCNGIDNLIVSCQTCNAAQGKKPMSYKWYDHWTTANKIKKHEKIVQALKSYDPSRTPQHA